MHRSLRILTAIIPAVLIAVIPALVRADGHFSFAAETVEIFINKDGSFDVVDTRSYSGSSDSPIVFTFGDAEMPGLSSDISVSESSLSLRRIGNDESLIPGTYQEIQNADHTITISLEPTMTEDPVLTLSYQVTGAVKRYLDIADLRWTTGTGHEERPEAITVTLNLPDRIESGAMNAWIHASDRFEYSEPTEQQMQITASMLAHATPLSIRCIFPTQMVAGDILPMTVQSSIQTQEEELQNNYERSLKIHNLSRTARLVYFLGFQPLALGGWLYWYFRIRRQLRQKVARSTEVESDIWAAELPARVPAAVPFLADVPKEQWRTLTVLSTIFDLTRRGHIRFEEEKRVSAGLHDASHSMTLYVVHSRPPDADEKLAEFETELLEILFPENDLSSRSGFSEILARLKQRRILTTWSIQGKKLADRPLKAPEAPVDVTRPLSVVAWILLFTGVPVVILAQLLLPRLKVRETTVTASEKEQWLALKHALLDLSKITHVSKTSLTDRWERYLALALACGAAKGLIDLLPDILSHATTMPTWYVRSGEVSFNTADISTFRLRIQFIVSQLTEALESGRQKK